ncbi:geranylgeranyl reductase family protein [uncultured Desulfosarcina sp.]|uniref:geranylgeranyl reductase family protein n=1 Tax=uncultured Desulfosarcina sp. TaxID=218289 RepID=UPI0029C66597|nr:geranylgeranyl reductase family protein [uncultured Desulfosarcina sp.]
MGNETSFSYKGATLTADVVIVGAGPSGCSAAYDLSVKGLRVLLLDRTDFPRKKSCAGGLTIKAARALRYSLLPVIQKTVCNLSVSCRMRHRRLLKSIDPICHLVERSAFDFFCLKKTVAAGACFAVVKRIDQIVESPRTVALMTEGGLIRSRFLIGADGVNSRIRRLTARFLKFQRGFAVEGIVDRAPPAGLGMGFDFGRVSGGYGWVFPKQGHLNVGLYTLRPDVKITRQDLVDYALERIGRPMPTRITGYPLGMGGWRYRPGNGRVLLVGDAAGLVDPLLGEGLYHAIISGQRAAAAIVDAMDTGSDACNTYANGLMPIQHDLVFARVASAFFYRMPGIGLMLVASPPARIPLMTGFSRGISLLDIFLNAYRFWFGLPGSVSRKQD